MISTVLATGLPKNFKPGPTVVIHTMGEPLAPYEIERLRRIEHNKAVLVELGIDKAADELKRASLPPHPPHALVASTPPVAFHLAARTVSRPP